MWLITNFIGLQYVVAWHRKGKQATNHYLNYLSLLTRPQSQNTYHPDDRVVIASVRDVLWLHCLSWCNSLTTYGQCLPLWMSGVDCSLVAITTWKKCSLSAAASTSRQIVFRTQSEFPCIDSVSLHIQTFTWELVQYLGRVFIHCKKSKCLLALEFVFKTAW